MTVLRLLSEPLLPRNCFPSWPHSIWVLPYPQLPLSLIKPPLSLNRPVVIDRCSIHPFHKCDAGDSEETSVTPRWTKRSSRMQWLRRQTWEPGAWVQIPEQRLREERGRGALQRLRTAQVRPLNESGTRAH